MKLFENHNTAIQKYGEKIVNELTQLGLPPQYLLAACRFNTEDNVPPKTIVIQIREWMTYIAKYENIDIYNISYDEFSKLISDGKKKNSVPNVIIYNDNAILGEIKSIKDARNIPADTKWCIKGTFKYNEYINRLEYRFYVIYLPNEPSPFTYTIVAIHDGEVEYWDEDNNPYRTLIYNNKVKVNNIDEYQSKLPMQIVNYLYNIAAQQAELKENNQIKYINTMNKIRLTESQLHRVIKESVNRLLTELFLKTMNSAYKKLMDSGQEERAKQLRLTAAQSAQNRGDYYVPDIGNKTAMLNYLDPNVTKYADMNVLPRRVRYNGDIDKMQYKAGTYFTKPQTCTINPRNYYTNPHWNNDDDANKAFQSLRSLNPNTKFNKNDFRH